MDRKTVKFVGVYPISSVKMTFIGHPFIHLTIVDSTNSYLTNAVKTGELSSGAIVLADQQTGGKGQRNKLWASEAYNNLTMSFAGDLNLWRIKNPVSLVHIVALSLRSFLLKYVQNVRIKWPNDLMVNDRKIAGILIENQISSERRSSVVGIGLNVNQTDFEFPRATSLYIETGKNHVLQDLLFEIIEKINEYIFLYQQKGQNSLFELFNQQLWKLEENHLFHFEDITKKGTILGSTMDGQLLVDFEGKKNLLLNGTVRY